MSFFYPSACLSSTYPLLFMYSPQTLCRGSLRLCSLPTLTLEPMRPDCSAWAHSSSAAPSVCPPQLPDPLLLGALILEISVANLGRLYHSPWHHLIFTIITQDKHFYYLYFILICIHYRKTGKIYANKRKQIEVLSEIAQRYLYYC